MSAPHSSSILAGQIRKFVLNTVDSILEYGGHLYPVPNGELYQMTALQNQVPGLPKPERVGGDSVFGVIQ